MPPYGRRSTERSVRRRRWTSGPRDRREARLFAVRLPHREGGGHFAGANDADAGLDLRNILRVLIKRKWLIVAVTATFVCLGLVWALLQTPLYKATLRLQIDQSAPQIVKGAEQSSPESNDFSTEIELLKSLGLAERVASRTRIARDQGPNALSSAATDAAAPGGSKLADQRRAAAAGIIGRLVVKPVVGTRLVDISYSDPSPTSAQRIANAYGEAYIAANLDKRFQANAYAKSFLEDQLKQLKLRLEESEKSLLAFAEKEQIVQTNDRASVAESNLAAANSALGALIAERIKNEQLWRQAEYASGINVPQILTNRAIEELRSRRGQLVTEYQEKLETFRADYPAMVQISNKIKEIDHQIGVEVKAIKSSLKAAFDASSSQETEMKQRIDQLRGELLDLQKRSIQYNILKREVDSSRSLYESLLQRYKEVDVASGVGTNRVFIIDAAQLPTVPSWPNKLLTLLAALALGFGVSGAAIVLAREVRRFDLFAGRRGSRLGSTAYWRHSEIRRGEADARGRALQSALGRLGGVPIDLHVAAVLNRNWRPKGADDHQRDADGRENKHCGRHRATIRRHWPQGADRGRRSPQALAAPENWRRKQRGPKHLSDA